MQIKFSPPDITDAEIAAVAEALKSGWITTGPKTKLFENRIAAYCGTKKAVCLNSATAALELCLRVLGIGEGDEVITSAYTYTASASVIAHVGAKIVLVDTAPNSYFFDNQKLDSAITKNTKAIIPVDIAGVPADYQAINKIIASKADKFFSQNPLHNALGKIAVICDAAHSFGAKYNSITSGSYADFTCFSFHAVKNLTTAEGGALTWKSIKGIDDEALYKDFYLWALHGQNKSALEKSQLGSWEYDIDRLGYKYNMTDIMAAIGLAQLDRYDNLLARRKQIQKFYQDSLGSKVEVMPHSGDSFESSYHLALTKVVGASEEKRNSIITKLAQKGIATNVHYKPLPLHTAYKNLGFDINDYPNSYAQFASEITLPLHTLLKDVEIDYIIKCYKESL